MSKFISILLSSFTYINDARSGTTWYKTIDPSVFRHGQMVQVQFPVLTVPMTRSCPGQGFYNMVTNLRSICIIDRKIQEVSSLSVCFNCTASQCKAICQEYEVAIISTHFQYVLKFGKDKNKKKQKVGYQTSESSSSDMQQAKKGKHTMLSFGQIGNIWGDSNSSSSSSSSSQQVLHISNNVRNRS